MPTAPPRTVPRPLIVLTLAAVAAATVLLAAPAVEARKKTKEPA